MRAAVTTAGRPGTRGWQDGEVERFIDRLRAGKLRPYTPDVLGDPVEYENTVREQISEELILRNHRAPTMAELDQLTRFAMEHSPIRGVERFDRAVLSGIPVIAADDVARYCATLPTGTDVSDVVATMAPPRQASETAPDEHLPAPTTGDPDASGAGWVEHNKTQNHLARIVAARGWAPRSPRAEEPRYDLAWARGQTIWVAEVKSVTSQNEERQLRTAIGQVLRYRQKLTAIGHDVQAVIVTSRLPSDPSWDELCRLEGIVLAWPEVASERLAQQEPLV